MTAIEQYLVDTARAARHRVPPPPPPGQGDLAALRSLRTRRRFRAVTDGRPATGPGAGRYGWLRLWRQARQQLHRPAPPPPLTGRPAAPTSPETPWTPWPP
ncbi:hypothetical protein LG634_05285 [Streptomyces bambusae]|uniref:hypothetical protein n=1 Tax=Streptomyces bambusae TaxID=1550616 RepID=UPI001CFDD8B7|nr:hypothetical protein [Streptomyces bambusae]MCB5164251.1 hypothetical protein [Streptomyces bambusae]